LRAKKAHDAKLRILAELIAAGGHGCMGFAQAAAQGLPSRRLGVTSFAM